jgi:hypothetical protein
VLTDAYIIVMEWKVIQIDYLDVGGHRDRTQKAEALGKLDVDEVLAINFNKREKFKKGTIGTWIQESVIPQLKGYVVSEVIQELAGDRELRAHLVLIVGSRQILVWDMDENGEWTDEPTLI